MRDDQEREVPRNDGPIELGMCGSTHVLRQPSHDDGQEETEEGGDGRREHTRNEGEGCRGLVRPCLKEGDEGGKLVGNER